MKKVLLLDGYNLMYRARYSGMNKGKYSAIFNFFRGLRPLIEKFNPDICYLVLEGRPVKRLENDANYKGQRVYTNEDNFSEQRREMIRILKSYFPINIARHKDYECDDVINYLAKDLHNEDECTIISSDTDFIQSISETVKLYNPVKKDYIEKFDYDYVSWKSLVGDKSDNIEGFKGIGNKRAISLLSDKTKFDELMSISENRNKFENNMFMIRFHDMSEDSRDIEFSFPKNTDWNLLKKEFINFEFNSIIGKEKTWEKYVKTFKNLKEAKCL